MSIFFKPCTPANPHLVEEICAPLGIPKDTMMSPTFVKALYAIRFAMPPAIGLVSTNFVLKFFWKTSLQNLYISIENLVPQ
jgi:hypothetical protein